MQGTVRHLFNITAAGLIVAALIVLKPTGVIYPGSSVIDLSWPNCKSIPAPGINNGILGVNGGLDFHANHCLGQQSGVFSNYAAYVNTGYPGHARGLKYKDSPVHCKSSDYYCLGYNYGYNAALYSLKVAVQNNVHTRVWWLDVETDNSWTDNFIVNRYVLIGMRDAINAHVWGAVVGIYSAPIQWRQIVGPWKTNQPVWLATGGLSKKVATADCGQPSLTDGVTSLSQYTDRVDINVVCNHTFINQITSPPVARFKASEL